MFAYFFILIVLGQVLPPAMDWQDFGHLIREPFEKEFNTSGGEVKITIASKGGVSRRS